MACTFTICSISSTARESGEQDASLGFGIGDAEFGWIRLSLCLVLPPRRLLDEDWDVPNMILGIVAVLLSLNDETKLNCPKDIIFSNDHIPTPNYPNTYL